MSAHTLPLGAEVDLGGGQPNPLLRQRGRPRPELPRLTPERPPRLRRIAELIDRQADQARDPAKAREIARRMRVRATELEAGREFTDAENSKRLQAEMTGEADLEAEHSGARLARHRRLAGSGP